MELENIKGMTTEECSLCGKTFLKNKGSGEKLCDCCKEEYISKIKNMISWSNIKTQNYSVGFGFVYNSLNPSTSTTIIDFGEYDEFKNLSVWVDTKTMLKYWHNENLLIRIIEEDFKISYSRLLKIYLSNKIRKYINEN